MRIRPRDTMAFAVVMIKAGYTCRGLAKAAGLTDSTVANLLRANGRSCSPPTAAKICRALGLTFEDLFTILDG